MASNFMEAFDYMIRNEDFELSGDVKEEPNGGSARFGINSVFHPQALEERYYSMTRESAFMYATQVFQKEYWIERGFEEVDNQRVATKLFDMAVAMGNKAEIVLLQDTLEVSLTGNLDGLTRAALEVAGPAFLDKLTNRLKTHYLALHDSNPRQYRNSMPTILARAAKLPK